MKYTSPRHWSVPDCTRSLPYRIVSHPSNTALEEHVATRFENNATDPTPKTVTHDRGQAWSDDPAKVPDAMMADILANPLRGSMQVAE